MIEIKEMINTATKEEFLNKKVLICQLQGFRSAVGEYAEALGDDENLLYVSFGGELLAMLMGLISEEEFDSFVEESFNNHFIRNYMKKRGKIT